MEVLGTVKSVMFREHQDGLRQATQRPKPSEAHETAPQLHLDEYEGRLDKGRVEELVAKIQEYVDSLAVELKFQVHDKTGVLMVKVIKEETGEVIREVPPEQLLDLAARIDEMIGALLDAKA
ncbi:MAG: flagellar protein FlaG [Deltaproteobacteria bacterium]|nr:flagellar protein FlaG [Deltaproteobacteria bacterium]MBW2071773.1 flagellar protein FlaG [Deltaproteobacteria bacterium]